MRLPIRLGCESLLHAGLVGTGYIASNYPLLLEIMRRTDW